MAIEILRRLRPRFFGQLLFGLAQAEADSILVRLNLFAPFLLAFARSAEIDDLAHESGLFAEGVDRHHFRFLFRVVF
jgi:hypothetical protein